MDSLFCPFQEPTSRLGMLGAPESQTVGPGSGSPHHVLLRDCRSFIIPKSWCEATKNLSQCTSVAGLPSSNLKNLTVGWILQTPHCKRGQAPRTQPPTAGAAGQRWGGAGL